MSSDDGASMLSEEILLNTLSYMNPTDVIAAAGTCRSWRNIVRGPRCASLLKNLAEKHYPSLLKVTPATLNDIVWFDLLARLEILRLLADETLERYINTSAASIRESEDLYGQCRYCGRKPYEGPTSGTSATAIPNENGRFAEPVYYDWGANWDRVSDLVEKQEVQQILMRCVNEVTPDGYYFNDWNEETIWPFLFNSHRRYGNGEQEALMNKHLSATQLRELNGIAADRLRANFETYLSSDTNDLAVRLAIRELESGMQVDEDAMNEEVDEMVDNDGLYESLDEDVPNQITQAAEAILYSKSGPGSVREVLLCTMGASYAFMPLNYILANRVSPDDANLTVFVGGEYSVVFDEERNIVFDNFWYFLGVPASEALEKSKHDPVHPSRFDYSLGGIAN